ncbi:hypothetical protein ACGFQG_32290 [Nocardia fluminea]|uniref:hypothetical protein n=1 Tax=Nocardia fluminea TaxID=134984 RepID=UPI003710B912
MNVPTDWSRDIWRRAATPAIPAVELVGGRMVSDATIHHADYVGHDLWVVDFLPGRTLTRAQARAAMQIAIAPDQLEVQRWAAAIGMTSAEARGYVQLSEVSS